MAAKKAEVIITCDASTVKQVLEGLNREMEKTNQRRQQLQQKQQAGIRLTKAEEKELQQLVKYENALAEKQQKTTGEMRKFGEVMKDLAGSKTKDLKRALNEGKRALDNMSAKDKNRQKLIDDLRLIQRQIDKNTASMKNFGATHNSVWSTAVRNIGAYMGVFAAFNKVKSMVENVFKANLKLSDSLADIRKVSGLTMGEINQLYTSIAKIDTRNTIETLNQLAYTGAKLGIGQNYGVQGLIGFVKAAEQVQMALGEDMGEKALPELAKMTEVMGLIDNYGVEQAMQKTASAIFQLGATSTATGTNIVEFSKRLYGLANVSNVSADELLALGSAADAMGLMPEVAATAFNKLFTSLQRNHNLIEKSLDIPKGTIDNLYSAGKTMDAIVMIFEKMKETGNLNALGNVFKDLGSDGARLVNVMATMSDRVDILRKHLKTSTEAFKDGEAVIAEYMIQNETAAAKMERAGNVWIKAFANPEGVDMVKEMADEWYRLSKEMTQNNVVMFQLRTSIQGIALAIQTLIKLLPFLIHAFAAAGILASIRSIYFGITSLITAIRTATTAQMTLNAAMRSNVVLAAVSAVAALAAMWYEAAKAEEWAAEREAEHQAELQKAYAASKEAIEDSVRPLKAYKAALDNANMSEKERVELVKDFNGDYQDYLDYLGIEVKTVDDLAAAYGDVVKIMKQKRAYEERENYRDRVNGENKMNRIAAGAEVERELKKMKAGQGIDKAWVMANQNLGVSKMYDAIMRETYGVGAVKITGTGKGRWQAPDAKGKMREVTNMALWNALNSYIGDIRTERDLNRQVNDMFKDDVGDFDIDKWNEERLKNRLKRKGGLTNEKPDKAAIAAARKAAQERKQALRKEMQDSQKEAEGVIAKINELYNLQESVINDYRATGKITEEEQQKALEALKVARNTALEKARRAVVSGDETEWRNFADNEMQNLLVDQGEWSTKLFQQIQSTNIQALHDLLAKFNGGMDIYGLDSSAFFDLMLKKAASNRNTVNQTLAKAKEELDKMLLKYEYFDKATRTFANNLVQVGAIGATAEQMAKGMEGVANEQQTISAASELAQHFRSMGAQVYQVNPEDEKQIADMMRKMLNDVYEVIDEETGELVKKSRADKWLPLFPNLDLWLKDEDRYKVELQNFYNVMLQMESDYYKASKQTYEHYKKENEQRWEESGRKEFYDQTYTQLQNQQTQQDVFGTGQTFGQQYGLADAIANDPEVELYKQKLQAAAEYYQFVESHQHTEQELREAGQATLEAFMAMAKKVGDEVAERAAKIQELQQPVTDFAEEAGQKLGDMLFNMKSQSMTWNQIIKKMILSFAQMTVKMAAENLTKKIQQALFYKQMQAMEIEHQTTMLGIQTAFGAMQIGAQQSINTTKQVAQTADNTATVAKEVSLATILTSLGISEGAAKTIGALGWWGIPLIAVISSLLLGLLASALSTAGSESAATSSSTSTSSASTAKLKLGAGMLTYDNGNVQSYVGNDGNVYQARQQDSIPEGVSLVKSPIATMVNGEPSLVAEKGPELVVGRKTTRAIMMNEPELLKRLAYYNRNNGSYGSGLRTLDNGNIEDMTGPQSNSAAGTTIDAETAAALRMLPMAMGALTEQLKKPVHINMYGKDSLDESMNERDRFRKRHPV